MLVRHSIRVDVVKEPSGLCNVLCRLRPPRPASSASRLSTFTGITLTSSFGPAPAAAGQIRQAFGEAQATPSSSDRALSPTHEGARPGADQLTIC